MQSPQQAPALAPKGRLRAALSDRFSLAHDQAQDQFIDESLRSGAELRGATPWVLMFAIFVASIGLNVNSTAVIIGAMLISPLMGPIMGIGYGVGIYDFALIRRSLASLGIATVISLATSMLYFTLSPLTQAQSELLARTTPTIWDVLIALFGGLAGIVGATRKEKSNVIPGVAIATALMPPLCTAGYGLANANGSYFFGAFYLFSINCVFIAVAAVVVIGLMKLPQRKFVDARVERRVKWTLLFIVLATTVPSVYLAVKLVDAEVFKNKAQAFVRREFRFEKSHVTELQVSPDDKNIEVTLIGEPLGQATLRDLQIRLERAGLAQAELRVHQAGDNRVDVTALKAGIVQDLYRDSQRERAERDRTLQALQDEAAKRAALQTSAADMARELKAQFPQLSQVVMGEGFEAAASSPGAALKVALLSASSPVAITKDERQRIENWFKVRSKSDAVRVVLDAPAAGAQRKAKPR